MKTVRLFGRWCGYAFASALLIGPALWACAAGDSGSSAGDASAEGAPEASAESGVRVDASGDADAGATEASADAPEALDTSTGLDAPDGSDSDWDGACVPPDVPVGLPRDPGYVSCVGEQSVAGGGECCGGTGCGDNGQFCTWWSPSGTCSENGNIPFPNGWTLHVSCDEPADCPEGQGCCLTTIPFGFDMSCSATCPPPVSVDGGSGSDAGSDAGGDAGSDAGSDFAVTVCKTHSDCADAGPCVVQYCAQEGVPARQMQTCGGIAPWTNGWLCSVPLNNEHVCAAEGGSSVPDGGAPHEGGDQ